MSERTILYFHFTIREIQLTNSIIVDQIIKTIYQESVRKVAKECKRTYLGKVQKRIYSALEAVSLFQRFFIHAKKRHNLLRDS